MERLKLLEVFTKSLVTIIITFARRVYMRKNFFSTAFWPLILAIVFATGYFFGNFSPSKKELSLGNFPINKQSKLNQIIDYIDNEYVDSTDREQLVDQTIENLLQKLDPHSYYITASELQAMNEPLEGSFEGIGVQFSIQKDTVVVVTPISGGPSAEVGIAAGDRIIAVDGELMAGTGIRNADVMRLLKGEGGTMVNLDIQRSSAESLLPFEVTRGKIPIYSVDVGYMINDTTGYIKVSRFSRETFNEFQDKYIGLLENGMTKLVLDLRGNGGGFMDAAINIVDQFLAEDQLVVYTEGRARKRKDYLASSEDDLMNVELAVLIDESSASASEIVAGAIQDNDRGVILGRRSFGKGLVQEQSSWPDGSATRLTIARYYTPAGRCIQKPYDNGLKAYHKEVYDRYENGEFESGDSTSLADSTIFKTTNGRTVYGGGGIMPDNFIPIDTAGASILLSRIFYSGNFYQFAFDYADKNREELIKYGSAENFVAGFTYSGKVESAFKAYLIKKKLKIVEEDYERSFEIISARVRAGIGRNIFGDEAFYPILHEIDSTLLESISAKLN